MDYPNHTTEHQAGKHFTYEDYITIELRLKDGWTAHKIAVKELHFAHPYTSCEKGSIENHNGLPRKILGYQTPNESFDEEMDKIFTA